jgi:hypothetical protein
LNPAASILLVIFVRYVNFLLSKWKEKPVIAWLGRHPFDISAVIILIIGAYFLIPMIMATVMNPPSVLPQNIPAASPPYESTVHSAGIYTCEIDRVYIKIFISNDGITYMNDKYKVSISIGDAMITNDLKGPYLDLQAMNSTLNIIAVPYDSNYEILKQTVRIGCVPDVSISMHPIKKAYIQQVDTNWQTEGMIVIDYNKDTYTNVEYVH